MRSFLMKLVALVSSAVLVAFALAVTSPSSSPSSTSSSQSSQSKSSSSSLSSSSSSSSSAAAAAASSSLLSTYSPPSVSASVFSANAKVNTNDAFILNHDDRGHAHGRGSSSSSSSSSSKRRSKSSNDGNSVNNGKGKGNGNGNSKSKSVHRDSDTYDYSHNDSSSSHNQSRSVMEILSTTSQTSLFAHLLQQPWALSPSTLALLQQNKTKQQQQQPQQQQQQCQQITVMAPTNAAIIEYVLSHLPTHAKSLSQIRLVRDVLFHAGAPAIDELSALLSSLALSTSRGQSQSQSDSQAQSQWQSKIRQMILYHLLNGRNLMETFPAVSTVPTFAQTNTNPNNSNNNTNTNANTTNIINVNNIRYSEPTTWNETLEVLNMQRQLLPNQTLNAKIMSSPKYVPYLTAVVFGVHDNDDDDDDDSDDNTANESENDNEVDWFSYDNDYEYENNYSQNLLISPALSVMLGNQAAAVQRHNLVAQCGVVHIIDKVLSLPLNLSDVLRQGPDLRNFLSLLNSSTNNSKGLDVMTNMTVFVPINQAFALLVNQSSLSSLTHAASSSSLLSAQKWIYHAFQRLQTQRLQGTGITPTLQHLQSDTLVGRAGGERIGGGRGRNDSDTLWNFVVGAIYTSQDFITMAISNNNITTLSGTALQIRVVEAMDRIYISNTSFIEFANIPIHGGLMHIINDDRVANETTNAKVSQAAQYECLDSSALMTLPQLMSDVRGRQFNERGNTVTASSSPLSLSSSNENTRVINRGVGVVGRVGDMQISLEYPQLLPNCGPDDKICFVASLQSSCDSRARVNQLNGNDNNDDRNNNNDDDVDDIHSKRFVVLRPQCYNVATHVCVNNATLCPLSHPNVCGDQCYSPSQYNCISSFSLCPSTHPLKCGDACYNRREHKCVRGSLTMHKRRENAHDREHNDEHDRD